MPRVHSQVARKDYPAQGIKRGDTYYKWSLRPSRYGRGITYRSKDYPKPWQLTSSPFLQQQYQIEHALGELSIELGADLESELGSIRSQIEELRDECQEKFDNMPEGLQQGDTGMLLEERVQACEDWLSELEGVEIPEAVEEPRSESDEEATQAWQEYQDELASAVQQLNDCSYPG